MISRFKARLKGIVRRQRDLFFPDHETRNYRAWMTQRLVSRGSLYADIPLEPGLLSIITAVWDGSPLSYFRELANSLASQMEGNKAEWFILANGCSSSDLLAYLQELSRNAWVKVHYASANTGIVKGLRACLERAAGRYILPVDADDRLYPDALRIVTKYIQTFKYPPLLYTDEDKVSGSGVYQPYFKPDWDPVLLANSAYTAHLGIADRQLAIELGAYGDQGAEGSPDWDLFIRFANAGYRATHIPEVVYSWRIHAGSTADDVAAKPYIRSSQHAVMRRFLDAQSAGYLFDIETSLLFGPHAAHLRFIRRSVSSYPVTVLESVASFNELNHAAKAMAKEEGFIGLVASGIQRQGTEWTQEALGLFELFPDTIMVGGRISNQAGLIIDGARYFGFDGPCGCPDAGRRISDPGYFGQLWKQRSVSAVGIGLALLRAAELVEILNRLPPEATLANLGCWIGASAWRGRRRIIYSPFLSAVATLASQPAMACAEEQSFRTQYPDLLPDQRFYPEPFSLTIGYKLPPPES